MDYRKQTRAAAIIGILWNALSVAVIVVIWKLNHFSFETQKVNLATHAINWALFIVLLVGEILNNDHVILVFLLLSPAFFFAKIVIGLLNVVDLFYHTSILMVGYASGMSVAYTSTLIIYPISYAIVLNYWRKLDPKRGLLQRLRVTARFQTAKKTDKRKTKRAPRGGVRRGPPRGLPRELSKRIQSPRLQQDAPPIFKQ